MSAKSLEAALVIRGENRTNKTFDEIEARAKKMEHLFEGMSRAAGGAGRGTGFAALSAEMAEAEAGMRRFRSSFGEVGSTMSRVAADAERAARSIGDVSRATRQATASARHGHGFMRRIGHDIRHTAHEAYPLVAGGAGFEAAHLVKESVAAGAEIQSARAHMKIAGIPDAEITAADLQAAQLAARHPNVTRAKVLELYKESRSVMTHPSETPEMMPAIVQAASSMNALDPSGKMAGGLGDAIKSAEILGKTKSVNQLRDYLDGFIRSQQVMGKTAGPEQLKDFSKYARSAGPLLSDRFLHTTANSLIQEERGSTAGKMIYDVVKETTGNLAGQHEAAKEFLRLGLVKKQDFELNKTGDIKGLKAGKSIDGAKLAQTDFDYFVYQKLLPAMEKAGIKQPQDQVSEARRLYPNSLASDLVAKLILQRQAFENHATLYPQAAGITGGETLLKEDPIAALHALGAALETFGGTVTGPIMKDAAGALSGMASTIGSWSASLAGFQKDHPDIAKVIAGGAVGGGLLGAGVLGMTALNGLTLGFGLSGASTHLEVAAAHLEGAAAKIGAGSALTPAEKTAEKYLGGAEGGAATTAAATAGVSAAVAAGVIGAGIVASGAIAYGHHGEKNAPYTAADTMFPTPEQEEAPKTSGGAALTWRRPFRDNARLGALRWRASALGRGRQTRG